MWLKSGGYIVINQTEALVAIDVNTGKYVGKSNRLEDTIVKTNTDAIKEIVRQIRLRDLGGIIVVDFIDMDERKNRQKVMQALEEAMRADRAPVQDSAVQRFRPGGHHPQAGEAEPGAHAVLAVPVLRRRGLREEPADGGGRDSAGSAQDRQAVEGKDVMLRVAPGSGQAAEVQPEHATCRNWKRSWGGR